MDASDIHARRLNAKEVLTPQRSGNFIFSVADGTVKIFGREQRLRTPTLTRDCPERGEEREIIRGRSDESDSPTPLQEDSTRDDEEAKNDFRTTYRIMHFIVITLNPESNCTCRKKKQFLFRRSTSTLPEKHIHHWTYFWRKILKITGTWMEKKELSDAWTGFTRFILLNERPPEGYTWSGGRLTRNKQPQDQTMYGQICGNICLMQRKRKQNKGGQSRNQSSTMPDN